MKRKRQPNRRLPQLVTCVFAPTEKVTHTVQAHGSTYVFVSAHTDSALNVIASYRRKH